MYQGRLEEHIDIPAIRRALKEILNWDRDAIDLWFQVNDEMLSNDWTPHDGTAWVVASALFPVKSARERLTREESRALSDAIEHTFPYSWYCTDKMDDIPWNEVRNNLIACLAEFGMQLTDINPSY